MWGSTLSLWPSTVRQPRSCTLKRQGLDGGQSSLSGAASARCVEAGGRAFYATLHASAGARVAQSVPGEGLATHRRSSVGFQWESEGTLGRADRAEVRAEGVASRLPQSNASLLDQSADCQKDRVPGTQLLGSGWARQTSLCRRACSQSWPASAPGGQFPAPTLV